MKRYLPFVIIAGVLIIALAGGAVLWHSSQPATTQPFTQTSPTAAATSPRPQSSAQVTQPASTVPDNPHSRGGANAKVTLEEYGDYQCPPCGQLYPDLKTIEKEYGDQIRFVFRQFPLQMHKHAFVAAHAAEAAGLQGHFWEMHDMLYQNQINWSVAEDAHPIFIQYAKMLGLNVDRFTRDMDSQEIANRVLADIERGKSVGVEGTPTVFINGRQMRPEAVNPDGLHKALDFMLGKTK